MMEDGDYVPYNEEGDNYEDYQNLMEAYENEQQEIEIIQERLETSNYVDEITNLARNCVTSVAEQSFHQLKLLIFLCFLLRLTCCFSRKLSLNIPAFIFHLLSCILGLFSVHNLFNDIYLPVLSMLFTYVALIYSTLFMLCSSNQKCGYFTMFLTLSFIFISELFVADLLNWHRVRGVFLILSMKSVSVAFDIDTKSLKTLPSLVEFSGYMLHIGTILFGPWISYEMYKKSITMLMPLTMEWLYCCIKSLFIACICLLFSSCFLPYIFFDIESPFSPFIFPIVASPWMSAYLTAVSFHFSHFYIAYLSLGSCLLSGVGVEAKEENNSKKKTKQTKVSWNNFQTTKPLSVEFPMSMLSVVVGWNIQMSKWLNTYVFKTSQRLGKFPAVMLTYLVSAMLHGLSFHLACVLLSLAFYTYVEYKLRKKLAAIYECPYMEARHKKDDNNEQKIPVKAYFHNAAWLFINIMHLAYLGSMFASDDDDLELSGYSMFHTIRRWSNLGYASHLVALACYLFYLML